MLIGRVISNRKISPHALHEVIFRAWVFAPSLQIEDLQDNHIFDSGEEHDLALTHDPWNIKGSLLALKPWPSGISWQEVNLSTMALCV